MPVKALAFQVPLDGQVAFGQELAALLMRLVLDLVKQVTDGRLECDGVGATPPAFLFEITLGKGDTKDFYDVSIVDCCPKELQVVGGEGQGNVVACKSACEAFGLDQYCCAGEFANPTTCRPSFYSSIFKRACPRAYSYAYDDGTSTFTCKANDYAIIFCLMNGVKRPNDGETTPPIEESKMEKFSGTVSSSKHSPSLPHADCTAISIYISINKSKQHKLGYVLA
ncbi:hypothetical protein RND71_018066 [Anisodus tanguticus]|uniref:Uncharacterized protein n=1 Tax=Anisodus tanguticus TaxID=243964 RepID=A0AAE1S3N3_9SOLA|nr:hypothetical protein RND71_018066 [Anisodus tanguticus]